MQIVYILGKWYWLKRTVFILILQFRMWRKKNQASLKEKHKGNEMRGYGYGDSNEDMEKPQPLCEHPHVSL